MAKFSGVIGYVSAKETAPESGVWMDDVVERNYSGDILQNTKRWEEGQKVNDDLTMNNRISIVADSFANANLYKMRYVKWMGAVWKITNVDIQRPRLILTMGGVYNGPTAPTPNPV
jgi:hypothetical protein